jgi:hypothetical protein
LLTPSFDIAPVFCFSAALTPSPDEREEALSEALLLLLLLPMASMAHEASAVSEAGDLPSSMWRRTTLSHSLLALTRAQALFHANCHLTSRDAIGFLCLSSDEDDAEEGAGRAGVVACLPCDNGDSWGDFASSTRGVEDDPHRRFPLPEPPLPELLLLLPLLLLPLGVAEDAVAALLLDRPEELSWG